MIVGDKASTHGYESPCCDQEWQIASSPKVLEHQIGWDIDADVRNVEDGQGNIELVAREVELCGEPVDFGIANVTIDFST